MKYFCALLFGILMFDLGYVMGHSIGAKQGIDETIAAMRREFQNIK